MSTSCRVSVIASMVERIAKCCGHTVRLRLRPCVAGLRSQVLGLRKSKHSLFAQFFEELKIILTASGESVGEANFPLGVIHATEAVFARCLARSVRTQHRIRS